MLLQNAKFVKAVVNQDCHLKSTLSSKDTRRNVYSESEYENLQILKAAIFAF